MLQALPAASQTRLALSKPLRIKWKYETSSTVNLTPAFDKGNVYLPLAAGDVVSLSTADGELNWKTETGGDISASPVADERGVYIASETTIETAGAYSPRATGAVRALGQKSGVTLWMRTLQSPIRGVLA
ncbi:MAG TPA: PQQ-binding-like beta-propeller repeat protein, partial [Pyrinomonadaceae bacterium]